MDGHVGNTGTADQGWEGAQCKRTRAGGQMQEEAGAEQHVRTHHTEPRAGGEREWSAAAVGSTKISAKEVKLAIEGDLAEAKTQRAMYALWRVFEAHAIAVYSDEGRAARVNVNEQPRAMFHVLELETSLWRKHVDRVSRRLERGRYREQRHGRVATRTREFSRGTVGESALQRRPIENQSENG